MRRPSLILSTAALTLALGFTAGAPAQAAGRSPALPPPATTPVTAPVTTADLLSPLSLAAGRGGSLLVTQNFAGTLDAVSADGVVTARYRSATPGAEVGAVSRRDGTVFFAESTGAGQGVPANNTGVIKALSASGAVRTIGDVATFEKTVNPDRNVRYGFRGLAASCLAQVPTSVPATYTGERDSHPYATEPTRSRVYVADAGGNDIVSVDRGSGRVRLVAILPAQPLTVTAALAASQGLPACTVGKTYWFESVPTDVRMGRDGWLYVSTLPGGPEDPSLGARGKVYRVNPWTGAVHEFASGLASPTGLAFSPRGDLYVAELFGGRVSVIPRGSRAARPFVTVPLPGDVAVKGDTLYVTVNAVPGENTPPAGQIVKVGIGRDDAGRDCPDQDDD